MTSQPIRRVGSIRVIFAARTCPCEWSLRFAFFFFLKNLRCHVSFLRTYCRVEAPICPSIHPTTVVREMKPSFDVRASTNQSSWPRRDDTFTAQRPLFVWNRMRHPHAGSTTAERWEQAHPVRGSRQTPQSRQRHLTCCSQIPPARDWSSQTSS